MAQPHSHNLAPAGTAAVVTVSKSFGKRAAPLAALVAWSVEQVLGDDARRVHVKVKRAGKVNRFNVEHRGRMFTFRQQRKAVAFARSRGVRTYSRLTSPPEPGVKGWAYDGIPFSALPGCDYLVTITIGSERDYPVTLDYRKTVPMTMADLTEEIVAIASHEAQHSYQYMNSLSRSEVECDQMALTVLDRWRNQNAPVGVSTT